MPPSAGPSETLGTDLLRARQAKGARLDAAIAANLAELGYGE